MQAIGVTPSAAYSAANAGVHQLVKNLALEFADSKIRINAVAPAVVETPVYGTFMSEAFAATLRDDDGGKVCACGMLGAEIATLEPQAAARLRRFYRANEAALVRILDRSVDDGTMTFAGDATALAKVIFAVLEGGMLVARADGGIERFSATTNQILAMVSTTAS